MKLGVRRNISQQQVAYLSSPLSWSSTLKADEARSSRVDGCGQKKRNQLIYGSPADVAEGGYNACLD